MLYRILPAISPADKGVSRAAISDEIHLSDPLYPPGLLAIVAKIPANTRGIISTNRNTVAPYIVQVANFSLEALLVRSTIKGRTSLDYADISYGLPRRTTASPDHLYARSEMRFGRRACVRYCLILRRRKAALSPMRTGRDGSPKAWRKFETPFRYRQRRDPGRFSRQAPSCTNHR